MFAENGTVIEVKGLVSLTEASDKVVGRIKPWLVSTEVYPVKFEDHLTPGHVLSGHSGGYRF